MTAGAQASSHCPCFVSVTNRPGWPNHLKRWHRFKPLNTSQWSVGSCVLPGRVLCQGALPGVAIVLWVENTFTEQQNQTQFDGCKAKLIGTETNSSYCSKTSRTTVSYWDGGLDGKNLTKIHVCSECFLWHVIYKLYVVFLQMLWWLENLLNEYCVLQGWEKMVKLKTSSLQKEISFESECQAPENDGSKMGRNVYPWSFIQLEKMQKFDRIWRNEVELSQKKRNMKPITKEPKQPIVRKKNWVEVTILNRARVELLYFWVCQQWRGFSGGPDLQHSPLAMGPTRQSVQKTWCSWKNHTSCKNIWDISYESETRDFIIERHWATNKVRALIV